MDNNYELFEASVANPNSTSKTPLPTKVRGPSMLGNFTVYKVNKEFENF